MTAARGVTHPARHALESQLQSVAADLADLTRTRTQITVAVWGIALGVMVYGAINVTGLLIEHGVWIQVAWLLSVMIDLAMCVALLGDRVLHRYGRQDRWVTALRWLTAAMTLVLNTTRPPLAHDWVGVGIHTAGPVLLMLVAEGANSFQRQLAAIIREHKAELHQLATESERETERETGTGGADETRPVGEVHRRAPVRPSPDGHRGAPSLIPSDACGMPAATRRGNTTRKPPPPGVGRDSSSRAGEVSSAAPAGNQTSAEVPTQARHGTASPAAIPSRRAQDHGDTSAGPERHARPAAGKPRRPHPRGRVPMREAMWQHWQECRAARQPVTGADLDRMFGTNNYGRRVINEWVLAGRITSADVAVARAPTAAA